MNKIIITTDLAKDKEKIIDAGFSLARSMKAEVELLVIINQNLDFMPADIGMDFADQWEARTYIAKQELNAIMEQHPEVNCEVVVFTGDPKASIIARAIESEAAIIVLGTHGRSGLSHLLMGSTAEYVIRHSPIPVLVVPLNMEQH